MSFTYSLTDGILRYGEIKQESDKLILYFSFGKLPITRELKVTGKIISNIPDYIFIVEENEMIIFNIPENFAITEKYTLPIYNLKYDVCLLPGPPSAMTVSKGEIFLEVDGKIYQKEKCKKGEINEFTFLIDGYLLDSVGGNLIYKVQDKTFLLLGMPLEIPNFSIRNQELYIVEPPKRSETEEISLTMTEKEDKEEISLSITEKVKEMNGTIQHYHLEKNKLFKKTFVEIIPNEPVEPKLPMDIDNLIVYDSFPKFTQVMIGCRKIGLYQAPVKIIEDLYDTTADIISDKKFVISLCSPEQLYFTFEEEKLLLQGLYSQVLIERNIPFCYPLQTFNIYNPENELTPLDILNYYHQQFMDFLLIQRILKSDSENMIIRISEREKGVGEYFENNYPCFSVSAFDFFF